MSDTTDISGRVEDHVADRLRVDPDAFDADSRFDGEAIDAESLDMVELAEAIEADLGVHIPDEDLESLATVGELVEYVDDNS